MCHCKEAWCELGIITATCGSTTFVIGTVAAGFLCLVPIKHDQRPQVLHGIDPRVRQQRRSQLPDCNPVDAGSAAWTEPMMVKAMVVGLVLSASPLIALFGLATLAASGTGQAGVYQAGPSEQAVADIPPTLLSLYLVNAAPCAGLPWQVIAGIGKVESDHGRFGGSSLQTDGTVSPPIVGIALDGTNKTATIRDTDHGYLDGDSTWDHAVGPFQFIPSSWAIFGRDGNADGVQDPQNVLDAIPAVIAHLCPTGAITDLNAAIFGYNRSDTYVQLVLDWAARYTGG